MDRAFRSAKDTYDNLAYLDQHKVGFIASTSTGKLLLGVLAAVAEFERELIRESTIYGLNLARANGSKLGRPAGSKDKKRRRRSGNYARYAE